MLTCPGVHPHLSPAPHPSCSWVTANRTETPGLTHSCASGHVQPAAIRGPHASQGAMDMAQCICRGHHVTVSEDQVIFSCNEKSNQGLVRWLSG